MRNVDNRARNRGRPDGLDLLPTEQPNPRTLDLDRLDTLSILERLNDEDQQVVPAVRAALPAVARAVELAAERWREGGRIVLFGAGTSGRLAMLDAAELGPTFGVSSTRYLARMAGGTDAARLSVEGAEDDVAAGEAAALDVAARDVAFGISASGRTPWVLAALRVARRSGAATLGLACVPRPELAAHADVTIVVETGPEPIGGSTRMKAGTAQKLVLNAFSTALMVRLGKVYGNLMVDMRATNAKLQRRAIRLVQGATGADPVAAQQALLEGDWDIRTAIVMVRLGCNAGQARARLAESADNLRRALGEAYVAE
ncbi:MAG: N-acetylmuramic acid 6-phosphate etherase [Chloroflexota bacterium]